MHLSSKPKKHSDRHKQMAEQTESPVGKTRAPLVMDVVLHVRVVARGSSLLLMVIQ